jgi:hypothetical protein
MQTFTVPIQPDGPLVDVLVGLAAADVRVLRNAGRPVPAPVTARALLDTGAEVTCGDPRILAAVIAGVPPGRFVIANLPATGGVAPTPEYTVGLAVLHPSGNPRANLILRSHPVVEQPLGRLGYEFLIGRDVLKHCLIVYDGPSGRLTLAY